MGPAPFDRKLREGFRLRLRCDPAINQITRYILGSSPLDICQRLLFGPFQGTWIYCNRFLAQFRTEWCRSHGLWLSIDSHHGVQVLFNFDRSGGRFQLSSGSRFRWQGSAVGSGTGFRQQVPVAGSAGRFQLQVPVAGSGGKFRQQAPVAGCSSRFR